GMDDPAMERDFTGIQAAGEAFAAKYRGRVAKLTASELAQALIEVEQLSQQMGRLGSYAGLQWTTDTSNAPFGALMQRTREVGSQVQQMTLFFDLEWAAIPEDHVKIVDDPKLARWRHYLLRLLDMRPHLLTEPEEKILAEKAVTGIGAWTRLFGEVFGAARYDMEGQKVPQEVVLRSLYMGERSVRKAAADSLTAGLRETLPTATFIYNTVLAEKASDDRLRKFPSWISARNLDNEASDATVGALVSAVTSRYDIVARYYNIKRKLLGVSELFDYDRYAPLEQAETRYQWNEARDIVLSAYRAFHPRMAEIAGMFFDKSWIHAPALPGKRSGAFCSPTITTAHPYVFLNFTGVDRDVMTLAHELGHGIHMYLSQPQGELEAGTPLTTAEMASVFGEQLVFEDLMKRETNAEVRRSMLARKIEDNFATIFRQISMNRFEDAIHTARREEGELSQERFAELWLSSQQDMFQGSVTMREDYGLWWSYIPHFVNTPGYVYAYAFGNLLVLALFNRYREEGAVFATKYVEVLSSGGSDRPEAILRKAGVDLTDPTFWQQGLKTLEEMVSQLEALV
ncbi:MAG TPA: M3 family oligoendopeptidase, partial [Aggregatilineales bacterium]|nr:M3 family oligoendopeptidase [Aggregatilineales bacterium]